jgi:phosphoglycolate phosphatase
VSSAVLFDLDGTLTDPKPGITKCIVYALERMGRPTPDADTLHWCIGPPLTRSFPLLLDDDDPDLVAEAIRLYRERFSEIGLYENRVYEGVPAMLRSLRTAGVRLFVATSKPTIFAVRILSYFELNAFFHAVYGSELDGTRADKADLIKYLLRIENLDGKSAVMVGDREHDVIGAHRCHLRAIGVRYGYAAEGELERVKADEICDLPEEVAPMALRMLRH